MPGPAGIAVLLPCFSGASWHDGNVWFLLILAGIRGFSTSSECHAAPWAGCIQDVGFLPHSGGNLGPGPEECPPFSTLPCLVSGCAAGIHPFTSEDPHSQHGSLHGAGFAMSFLNKGDACLLGKVSL